MAAGFITACTVLHGCGPAPTELRVLQPQLASKERDLLLTTHDAWVRGDGVTGAMLLELPLPGATRGRQFLIYVRLADRAGEQMIGASLPKGGFVAGYFLQQRGRRRGLTEFVSGRITLNSKPSATTKSFWGEMDVSCADGTRIKGRLMINYGSQKVMAYERESADAQALIAPSGESIRNDQAHAGSEDQDL